MSTRLAALVAALLLAVTIEASYAAVFTVTNYNDFGPGSLRQAMIDSNATPGPNVIEIHLLGSPPYVIRPEGQFLPPLKGPVVVRVLDPSVPPTIPAPAGGRGGARGRGQAPLVAPSLPFVVLDGSSLVRPRTPADCPGATARYDEATRTWQHSNQDGSGPNVRGYYGAGLAVHDTGRVEISGLEIRNFCIGIAVVRSNNVVIYNVRVIDSHGAAGVIFTGDDGSGGSTRQSYANRLMDSVLLDNGDGVEFTRGARDSIVQGTSIALTRPLPVDGSAVEFATSGDNNALMGNTLTKYVQTAVTVDGNRHTIRDNRIADNLGGGMRASGSDHLILGNTFASNAGVGLSIGGGSSRVLHNLVTGNAAQGIVVTGQGITISRNYIYGNGGLGIHPAPRPAGEVSGARGSSSDFPAADALPSLPAPPTLASNSTWTRTRILLQGSLAGAPNATYAIEVFASREPDRHQGDERGWGEGEKYLGTASARTDPSGAARFSLMLVLDDLFGDDRTIAFFTATATDASGSTSTFSRARRLARSE